MSIDSTPHGGLAGRDRGGPEIVELDPVPGFVVFDLPGVPVSAGGTRLAPDVSVAEVALLARAMTYKFATLGQQVGGAKAGVRGDPADRAGRDALMARFCAAIGPLADAGRFLTGPDMGTAEEDFAPLREHRAVPAAIGAVVDGVPFEDVLTGYGVAAATEAALRAGWGRGAGAGTADPWPSRGSARWAAGWRARSSAAAAAWSGSLPSPDASLIQRDWTSNCCLSCAASTAMGASSATADRPGRRACCSRR
jgi:hypothetical protein